MIASTKSSAVINTLKCILCLCVVYIHSYFVTGSFGIGDIDLGSFEVFGSFFIYQFLDKTCVPVFFIISGYLYFLNVDSFNIEKYRNKSKTRIYSLLVPYIIANLFHYIIGPFVSSGSFDFSFVGIFNALIGSEGFPADPPLWYVRDLILVCLFSPIIYYLVRISKLILPVLLIAFWIIYGDVVLNVIPLKAFSFFSVGAYMAIRRYDLLDSFNIKKLGLLYILLYVAAFSVACYNDYGILIRASVLFGLLFWLTIAYFISCVKTFSKNFVGATVFIYFYHYYLALMMPRLVLLIIGASVAKAYIVYIIGGLVSFSIMLSIYYVLNRLCPSFMGIIIGGRSSK